ncbi:DUF4180 domain-containing protein [Streptosporangium soli]|nr:DUF4180 domain-containing protein [Streptosporangium sp. KLBMP 9127]
MPMLKQDGVAVPAARLEERFFSLGSRFAGEPMQKVVNYRLKPAVGGKSNRSDHMWFVPDLDALLGVRSS